MRVAVTGAAGRIGRVVHRGLGTAATRSSRWTSPPPMTSSMSTSGTPPLSCRCCGCAGVVHLAANPNETSFEEARTHLRPTSVLEAMLAAGVPRIVYASSNHAVGFTPRVPMAGADTRHRPDTFYGAGRPPVRRCAACTPTDTAWPPSVCGSGRSPTGREPVGTCRPGYRRATRSGWSRRR